MRGWKFFKTLLLGCLSACSEPKKDETTWIVGVSADNPPFVFVDTQHGEAPVGFEVELIEALSKTAGKKLELRDMDFGSLIASLQSKRIDMAIASIEITPEREKSLDFSESYHQATTVLVSRKEAPLQGKISWRGLRIGTQLGSAHELYMKQMEQQEPRLTRISYNRVSEMVQDLNNGRLDGLLVETPVAKRLCEQYAFMANPLPAVGNGYGIALPKGSTLTPILNQALQKVRQDGMMKKLLEKWGL